MLACLRSAAVFGIDARLVDVEVDVSRGLPTFTMVGLPDAAIRESRDRVRSAIRNAGFEFPAHRVTINLAPADLKKEGTSFDLAIAAGILAASGSLPERVFRHALVVGELSLDGTIHAARGVLPMAVAARRAGVKFLIVPVPNAAEAAVVTGPTVLPVPDLGATIRALRAPGEAPTFAGPPMGPAEPPASPDLADVKGQATARRALEIAAAGGHHLLLSGPPGTGKTMLARRLPGLLPPLGFDEAIEVTAIHSVAGLLPPGAGLLRTRPFRAPHHTASDVALVGGGATPRPGEVSLAHHGVLFLDEAPEFSRSVLEVLRQPLEEGRVRIARAARTVEFPASFLLVAAMNPCPCGFLGDPARPCRCTPLQVQRYRHRLSGPFRDRIDLVVDVPALAPDLLARGPEGEPTHAVAARVLRARRRQAERGQRLGAPPLNARLEGRQLRTAATAVREAMHLLTQAAARLHWSARAFDRALKVARTIADLDESDTIAVTHAAEALTFRGEL